MTRPSNTTCGFAALHDSEEGMISLVNVIAILLCTILMGLVVNTGSVVRQKIEVQNAADATAYTDALWHARGMNAVTMTNHVIGELTAFVVLWEAIGGEDVNDTDQTNATKTEDEVLDVVKEGAELAAIPIFAYDTVRQDEDNGVNAERTLLESKKQLKQILIVVYGVKTVAAGLEKSVWPVTVAIGYILDGAAAIVEAKILQEYILLNVIHGIATGLKPIMQQVVQGAILPAAKFYTDGVVLATGTAAIAAAQEVATRNDTHGVIFPSVPATNLGLPLPLEIDPNAKKLNSNSDENAVGKTQLTRATYPWVTFHREPILVFMRNWLTLSGASGFYLKHTNECTHVVCRRLQTDGDIKLYMMKRDNEPDRGTESWTNDSEEADDIFTVVGFAHRDKPLIVSPVIYSQEQEDGIVAFAQAMFYNANPQNPNASPGLQAAVGWDTLNWEGTPVEFSSNPSQTWGTPFPKIKLNWQAKLVPVTNNRMLQAQVFGLTDGKLNPVLLKAPQLTPQTGMTHH